MAFGLSSQGFKLKRLDTVKTEIEDKLRSLLGPGINLEPESVFGQLVGVFADREALLWEQLQALYNAQYPDTAEGVQLDLAASLVGVTRRAATRSQQIGQLFFGDVGTVIPIGTQIAVSGNPLAIFQTLSQVTLVAGTDAQNEINFSAVPDAGQFTLLYQGEETDFITFADNATDVQAALEALPNIPTGSVAVSGTFSSGFTVDYLNELAQQEVSAFTVGSNSLTASAIAVTISFIQTIVGVEQGSSDLDAVNTGVVVANKFSLTEIVTPIFGLDSTINPTDASVGRELENDAQYRARRELEIQIAGASTTGAILAAVAGVTGVEAVFVFENDSPLVDGDGRPPHSIECVVQGGTDLAVAQKIFEAKAAGIGTHGTITQGITDSQGFSQSVKFSRPQGVPLLLEMDLMVDLVAFPVDGINLVKANFKLFIDQYTIGQDVIVVPDLYAALTGVDELEIDKVPGISRADIRISKSPTPPVGDSNIVIDKDELATIDISDITVNLI